MPTYDYECGACGEVLEVFQSITESPRRKCPSCGKFRLKRLIGAGGGILFKGSGFYETDYRSESYRAAAKAEAEGSKPSSDKKEKPSDSGSDRSSSSGDSKS